MSVSDIGKLKSSPFIT